MVRQKGASNPDDYRAIGKPILARLHHEYRLERSGHKRNAARAAPQ